MCYSQLFRFLVCVCVCVLEKVQYISLMHVPFVEIVMVGGRGVCVIRTGVNMSVGGLGGRVYTYIYI